MKSPCPQSPGPGAYDLPIKDIRIFVYIKRGHRCIM